VGCASRGLLLCHRRFAESRFWRRTIATRPTRAASTQITIPVRPIGLTVRRCARPTSSHTSYREGFDVIEPGIMKMATKNRVPTNTQMAAQILEEAHLDADRAVHRGTTLGTTPNSRGMKADGVIIALDVTIGRSETGTACGKVLRPSRPVPLYGVVLTGRLMFLQPRRSSARRICIT